VKSLSAADEALMCLIRELKLGHAQSQTQTSVFFLLPYSTCALTGHKREINPFCLQSAVQSEIHSALSVHLILAKRSLLSKQIDKQPVLVVLFWMFVGP